MLKQKLEKSVSESHREYLDLDTDEEEFGKQETPEPEDEADLEPEKPSFTTEELDILVSQVKNMTALPYLKPTDWNEDCEKVIQEYFCEPANLILIIYFDNKILKAALEFTKNTDNGLVYFLRAPWQIYDAKNFLSTVIFGNVNSKVECTMLSCLENIFAPAAFDYEEWPETSKFAIFENVHKLLICLTEIVYSPQGLTVLYVPSNSREIDFNTDFTNSEEFTQKIGRLGRVTRTWIVQLQNALNDSFYFNDKFENSVIDTVYFWVHKYTNLKQLTEQLCNENLMLILDKLREQNSPSAKKIELLKSEIFSCAKVAKLNLMYVDSLLKKVQVIDKPSEIEKYTVDILQHIKLITEKSSYYNSVNGLEKLCRAFSMQVIEICRNHLDLNIIFDNTISEAKEKLEIYISYCQNYQKCYNQVMKKEVSWEKLKINVFKYVIIFEERCRDIIEICNVMAVFAKVNEKCPLSSGPKAKCNELRFQEINLSFCYSLEKVSKALKCALDVTSVKWYRSMQNFRQEIKKLEQKIECLVDEVFHDDVHNANDSIDMVETMLEFKNTQALKKVLLRFWLKTWQLFIQEIKRETKITKIKVGEIPSEEEFKKLAIKKKHKIMALCQKMSKTKNRLNDYCKISIGEVDQVSQITKVKI